MASNHQLQKPAPVLQVQSASNSQEALNQPECHSPNGKEEYDPCRTAQKFSPFYMYNHDSPRPSADLRPKQSIHVDVKDLELGTITPSVTQEKLSAQQQKSKFDNLKFWEKRKQRCLTKPKKQWWLQRLPKKQRIAVKLLIAFIVAGTMVGIAVGIASALHSGVSGTNKVVGKDD